MFRYKLASIATAFVLASGGAHAGHLGVSALDQDVSAGTVTAAAVLADSNGWMVVHRTDDGAKPGPVVGHAPLKAGANTDVTAILTEPVLPGQKLMLMLHGEAGGSKTGIFEYTLGAAEDGPVKVGGKLVMAVISAE